MIVFIYDGSIEGLFSGIYESYYTDLKADAMMTYEDYIPDLLDNTHWINTDQTYALKVHHGILSKLGDEFYRLIIQVFLSEDEKAGTCIYEVLKIAFKTGPDCVYDLRNPIMLEFKKLRTAVAREHHLLLGIVRFVLLKNNIYYGEIEPKYHQLPLLGDHFSERMGDEFWVIRDLKRNLALFYDKKNWYIKALNKDFDLDLSDEEVLTQKLWKTFHKHTAIEDRRNEKLQGSYIPKRYWKHLIEDKT